MSDQQQNVFVTELMENVRHLSGSTFEQFGYRLLEAIHPGQWTHRGTTSEGAPLGYVVDSSANGARWVAQYSSEDGYFKGKLRKLKADFSSTTKKHPQVTHVWMFSNEERGPSEVTGVQNWVDKELRSGRTVRVLDVRDIAQEIYGRLDNDQLIETVTPFLPYLPKVRDMWALSHKVPTFSNYVPRVHEEDSITERLRSDRVAVVSGMSGFGKSALASAVFAKLKGEYDSVFWLDASSVSATEDLKQFDALRNGQKYNILGVAKRSRCLLILDDLKVDLALASLLQQLGPKSAVLITTQFHTQGAVTIAGVHQDNARLILEAGVATRCPDESFGEIFARTSGHPLLLSALNRIASDSSPVDWAQIRALCTAPTDVEDASHSPLHDRILRHHLQAARGPIAAIAWLQSPVFDPQVLTALAGPHAERALRSRHLLTAAGHGLARVHDLAFSAISRVAINSAEEAARLRESFCDRLETCIRDELVELYRVATVHRPLICRLLKEESHPALRYAYALPRAADTDIDLLGEPSTLANQYSEQGKATELDVWALVECIEARSSIRKRRPREPGDATLADDSRALSVLAGVPGVAGDLRDNIAHHQAKLMAWEGLHEEAEAEFRRLVSVSPDRASSRLQLGRLLLRKKPPEANEALIHARAILDLPAGACSDTVLLGAFELLAGESGRTLLKERSAQFATLLMRTALVGLDQPFEVLAALARDLWYHEPELLLFFASSLPNRLAALSSDKDRFAWAQLRKSVAKARLDAGAGVEEVLPILEEARDSYSSMTTMRQFELVQAAECSILLHEGRDAVVMLERVENAKRDAHWHHRRAQALRLDGKLAEADQEIEQAIADASARKYASAFLEERWRIRDLMGASDAVDSLREAVASSDETTKFGAVLRERLKRVQRSS